MSQEPPLITVVRDGMHGTREVCRGYTERPDQGGRVTIPSALAGGVLGRPDESGLQMSGFDPHSPSIELVDPECPGGSYLYDPKSQLDPANRSANVGYLERKKAPAPKPEPEARQPELPPVKASPMNNLPSVKTAFLHAPGVKVPFQFRQLEINQETRSMALVGDIDTLPDFQVTGDGEVITFEFPGAARVEASYYGQSVVVCGMFKVAMLVVERAEAL